MYLGGSGGGCVLFPAAVIFEAEAWTAKAWVVEAETVEAGTVEAETVVGERAESETVEAGVFEATLVETWTVKAWTVEALLVETGTFSVGGGPAEAPIGWARTDKGSSQLEVGTTCLGVGSARTEDRFSGFESWAASISRGLASA